MVVWPPRRHRENTEPRARWYRMRPSDFQTRHNVSVSHRSHACVLRCTVPCHLNLHNRSTVFVIYAWYIRDVCLVVILRALPMTPRQDVVVCSTREPDIPVAFKSRTSKPWHNGMQRTTSPELGCWTLPGPGETLDVSCD